jgi:hypothetical protein
MTSPEPDDDASLRRRRATADPSGEDSGPGGEGRRMLGPPVDPYGPDGRVADGQVADGSPGIEAPVVLDGPVFVGEPYHPVNPPRTEQERNEQKRQQAEAEAPPKPSAETIGRYPFEAPPISQPPDPIRMFLSGPKPRQRRSDWPVLVFALVVAATVTAGCCLAGFAAFTTWNPFSGP